jgi:ligand-binding sensor domain-containing protein
MFGKTISSKILVITILFFFVGLIVTAQSTQLIFDHYGLNDGLGSRDIKNIITTKNGMVWMTSDEGFIRYDSKGFKTYKHIEGDSNSVLDNNTTTLVLDKRGYIWIGGFNKIEIFDPTTDQFKHINFPYIKPDYYSTKPFPFNFYYDNSKDIMWITSSLGLYYCKGNSLKIQSAKSITKDNSILMDRLHSIAHEDNNFLWLTSGYEIMRFNTQNGTVEKYKVPNKINSLTNDEQYSYVSTSYLDNNKMLWLGTSGNGLVEFNTITKTFNQYYFNSQNTKDYKINKITQLNIKGQENLLYMSTTGYGLATFDITTKQFKFYKSEFIGATNGVKNNLNGLYIDTHNALWMGSDNGLYKLDINKQVFTSIPLTTIPNTTPLSTITRMACEQNSLKKDERLWFFIPELGCYIYDLSKNKILSIPQKVTKYINPKEDFYDFYIDSQNRLWINNNLYGVICYNIDKDEIIIPEKKYFYTKEEFINTFYEDSFGNIWIGTLGGLFVMYNNERTIVAVSEVNIMLEKNQVSKGIVSISEDQLGHIWFVADYSPKPISCIAKYNLQKNKCEIIFKETVNKTNKAEVNNWEEIIIHGNTGYISDFGRGILSFNITQKNLAFQNINVKNNIAPRYIRTLIDDNNHNIWCSTTFGLSFFNTKTGNFINYDYDTYLLSDLKYPNICLSKQSGDLFIGQPNCIRYINTEAIHNDKSNYELVFTDLKIFNKATSITKYPLNNGTKIKLDYDENMITIEFALLSYFNSKENIYQWKLEGLEKDWNTSKSNIASYSNLQPGTYTLLVKAANSKGEWTNKTIKLTIKIKPPFYKTWWFILICLLAIAGLIYWTIQRRINRLKEKYKLRNTIAADLHDEIGSTLTSISILSTISQQAMDLQPKQTKDMLEQIATQSKSIQQNMSDIVWSIRPDNERIENLIIRMREFAAVTLEPLNIKTTITADDRLIAKILPMHFRKEILLIYKEAVNNISKHANASNVVMQMTNGGHEIKLLIHDDGTWKGHNTGTGTKTMKERAHKIGGQLTITPSDKGTLVVLTIPIP